MQMGIAHRPTDAAKFALSGVAASLGIFGLLRLPWTEAHLVLPFTQLQATLAVAWLGTPALPVEATLACSGADALALCVGAVLAYPVPWRPRLLGAAGGTALILALNTMRIGTLGRVAASPAWFDALHLYVWPALLTLAIAGYVVTWMRMADRQPREISTEARPYPTRRFFAFTAAFVVAFVAASPLYLASAAVLSLAGLIARVAAGLLTAAGVTAHAAANILWTSRGGFLVTQECISTPLIPVYLAAVCAYSTTWRRLAAGLAAALPLFIALGVVRLLVVAIPATVMPSPEFIIHAFYQLLLGAVVVGIAAIGRHGKAAAPYAVTGIVGGALVIYLSASAYGALTSPAAGVPLADPQGAIALLPPFQAGLYLAMWIAAFDAAHWRRMLAGLLVLGLAQALAILALHGLGGLPDFTGYVTAIRAVAVAVPVLVFAGVTHGSWTPR